MTMTSDPALETTLDDLPPPPPPPNGESDLEMGDDVETRPERPVRRSDKGKLVPRVPRDNIPEVAKEITRQEDISLKDWIMSLGEPQNMQFRLSRKSPEMYKGVQTRGQLRVYEEPIDEEYIRKEHGGGTYDIKVFRRNDRNGGWSYFKFRRVEIAGNPRVDNLKFAADEEAAAVAALTQPTQNPIVERAFSVLERNNESMAAKIDKLTDQRHGSSSNDAALLIDAATRPLRETIARLETALERATAPKEPSTFEKAESKLLDKLIDQDSARLTAVKATYESEIRQLKEQHRDDEKRLRDEFARDKDRMQADHDRRIADAKSQHEATMTAVRGSLDIQLTFANKENDRLQREVESIRKELNELRAKKDKPILEQFQELQKIKEVFSDDDEDDSKDKGGTIERLVGKLVDSDIAKGVAKRVMANVSESGGPQMPVGIPFVNPHDGKMYVNNGQQIVRVRRKKKKTRVEDGGGGGKPTQATDTTAEKADKKAKKKAALKVSKDDVTMAVTFFETAYQGSQEPETVAESVRTMIPMDVLRYMSRHGVDDLLDEVAGLESSSPLAQQGGRLWIRKVAKKLLGDGD